MRRPEAGRLGKPGARYLLVQRVPGPARPCPGPGRRGRPLAAAALQEVHARRAAALLALEVEEHILVEGEPLLVPAACLRSLLAQEAALGALLAGQEGQVEGVPLVVAHALLHGEDAGDSPLSCGHLLAVSPQGVPARSGPGWQRAPPFLLLRTGHPRRPPGRAGPRGARLRPGAFFEAAAFLAKQSSRSPRRPCGEWLSEGTLEPPAASPKVAGAGDTAAGWGGATLRSLSRTVLGQLAPGDRR